MKKTLIFLVTPLVCGCSLFAANPNHPQREIDPLSEKIEQMTLEEVRAQAAYSQTKQPKNYLDLPATLYLLFPKKNLPPFDVIKKEKTFSVLNKYDLDIIKYKETFDDICKAEAKFSPDALVIKTEGIEHLFFDKNEERRKKGITNVQNLGIDAIPTAAIIEYYKH